MNATDITALLRSNSYPGRGIILGRSADNGCAVAAYFIMGRSANSRNRILAKTEDGIRTQAFDSAAMVDASLIIYHPVRVYGGYTIVTNGDHTDTIREFIAEGKDMRAALKTREFEPDEPNYTPRISGLIAPDGAYSLSVLKTMGGDNGHCCRFLFDYDRPKAGEGHFIHTYISDGSPLPSFAGEPKRVLLPWPDAESLADAIWDSLDGENKVSLYVRYTELSSGKNREVIKNRNV